MDQTNFDKLMQEYFPDIHRLNELSKTDVHLWALLLLLLENNTKQLTGRVEVFYTKGHIDAIKQTIDMLAFKASRPGY